MSEHSGQTADGKKDKGVRNVHDRHRARLRGRFLRYGLDCFEDHQVLELLLFYALGRKDTNALAHDLIEAFGTLEGVFDAPPEALQTVRGVGENVAVLLHLIPQAAQRYLVNKSDDLGKALTDSATAGAYLMPRFFTCRDETVYLVCMDAKLKVLDCRELNRGGTVSVSLDIRRIVQIALGQNATYVLLAHNHTSGIAIPSPEDVAATLRIRQILAQVGVTLSDHIVVAGNDFVSMADSGYLPPV